MDVANLDARLEKITHWLESRLSGSDFTIAPASSDASFRRYFRVRGAADSLIVMDAPPEHEETGGFCRIARRLRAIGLNVPEILAEDATQGFVLMSDLGGEHYLENLTAESVDRLYGDALGALVTLQRGTLEAPDFLPPYSRELLYREMDLYREWYLPRQRGHRVSAAENAIMDHAWQLLADTALEQPQVWVHRDYHSRNLMVTAVNNPGILDFQDAVTGPITYDLVSLLKDCYIRWPTDRVEGWVLAYHDLALHSGLLEAVDEARFLTWFRRMGIQRHLKVAGIFSRLCHRDGKRGYLDDIPLTLRYLAEALAGDDELADLNDLVLAHMDS